ncbi:hypothetical protein BgiMline_002428, partial [Biomphalaria glabrata]
MVAHCTQRRIDLLERFYYDRGHNPALLATVRVASDNGPFVSCTCIQSDTITRAGSESGDQQIVFCVFSPRVLIFVMDSTLVDNTGNAICRLLRARY